MNFSKFWTYGASSPCLYARSFRFLASPFSSLFLMFSARRPSSSPITRLKNNYKGAGIRTETNSILGQLLTSNSAMRVMLSGTAMFPVFGCTQNGDFSKWFVPANDSLRSSHVLNEKNYQLLRAEQIYMQTPLFCPQAVRSTSVIKTAPS